jgi:hypothetical protein
MLMHHSAQHLATTERELNGTSTEPVGEKIWVNLDFVADAITLDFSVVS